MRQDESGVETRDIKRAHLVGILRQDTLRHDRRGHRRHLLVAAVCGASVSALKEAAWPTIESDQLERHGRVYCLAH